jgi:hypothetical protein
LIWASLGLALPGVSWAQQGASVQFGLPTTGNLPRLQNTPSFGQPSTIHDPSEDSVARFGCPTPMQYMPAPAGYSPSSLAAMEQLKLRMGQLERQNQSLLSTVQFLQQQPRATTTPEAVRPPQPVPVANSSPGLSAEELRNIVSSCLAQRIAQNQFLRPAPAFALPTSPGLSAADVRNIVSSCLAEKSAKEQVQRLTTQPPETLEVVVADYRKIPHEAAIPDSTLPVITSGDLTFPLVSWYTGDREPEVPAPGQQPAVAPIAEPTAPPTAPPAPLPVMEPSPLPLTHEPAASPAASPAAVPEALRLPRRDPVFPAPLRRRFQIQPDGSIMQELEWLTEVDLFQDEKSGLEVYWVGLLSIPYYGTIRTGGRDSASDVNTADDLFEQRFAILKIPGVARALPRRQNEVTHPPLPSRQQDVEGANFLVINEDPTASRLQARPIMSGSDSLRRPAIPPLHSFPGVAPLPSPLSPPTLQWSEQAPTSPRADRSSPSTQFGLR